MKKLNLIILSLVLLFFACNKEADLMNTNELTVSSNSQAVTKTFRGNITTSIDPDPSNGPIACSGEVPNFLIPTRLLLHGSALHMGEFIWQQSTLTHVSCHVNVATMELTINVSGQMTANNGDRVFYTGTDVIDVTQLLLQQPNPTGSITGNWTITGGTGRFDEASGSLTINGSVDFATLTASFALTGTITY